MESVWKSLRKTKIYQFLKQLEVLKGKDGEIQINVGIGYWMKKLQQR